MKDIKIKMNDFYRDLYINQIKDLKQNDTLGLSNLLKFICLRHFDLPELYNMFNDKYSAIKFFSNINTTQGVKGHENNWMGEKCLNESDSLDEALNQLTEMKINKLGK